MEDHVAVETWIDNSEIFIFNKSIRTLHKSNFSTIDSLVNYQISELLVSIDCVFALIHSLNEYVEVLQESLECFIKSMEFLENSSEFANPKLSLQIHWITMEATQISDHISEVRFYSRVPYVVLPVNNM